jgi:cobalt-zinc-cadmium efflux system membrane fusion protein
VPVLSCKPDKSDQPVKQPAGNPALKTHEMITITRGQFTAAGMALGDLQRYSFTESIRASGFLDVPPQNRVMIGTQMGGFVKEASLLPGDYVKKGQPLVVLENMDYLKLQQDYLDAGEQLVYLKTVYESQKTLVGERITAQRSYAEARSNFYRMLTLRSSLARQLRLIGIDTATLDLEHLTASISILSPISGFITEVSAVNGMFVNPSDKLFEIVDCRQMRVTLKVFEKDVIKLKKGQAITFRLPEVSGITYTGVVSLIGKAISEEGRTVPVQGQVTDQQALQLSPGMYVEAVIHTNPLEIKGLPSEALISEEGGDFILVQKTVDDSLYVFEKIPVTVGIQSDTWFSVSDTNVLSQLNSRKILVKGTYFLTQE